MSIFLSLKKNYNYSTNFTFQRKAYSSSVITRGFHLWKLSLEIPFPNCNNSLFPPKFSLIIRRKQIAKGKVSFEICQKDFSTSPNKLFESIWEWLFPMKFISISVKYSSTIDMTSSSSHAILKEYYEPIIKSLVSLKKCRRIKIYWKLSKLM